MNIFSFYESFYGDSKIEQRPAELHGVISEVRERLTKIFMCLLLPAIRKLRLNPKHGHYILEPLLYSLVTIICKSQFAVTSKF